MPSNKQKNILLKNAAGKKILLTAEYMQWLNRSGYDVYTHKDLKNRFKDFFDLFDNIKSDPGSLNCDLVIEFVEDISATSQYLSYPVVSESGSCKNADSSIPVSENMNGQYHQPLLEDAIDFTEKALTDQDYNGLHLLISAGPTAEDVDPVRYMTNRSTGKMGIALARAAFIRGAEVKLICGPTQQRVAEHFHPEHIRSAEQMKDAISANFQWCDFFFSASAVADYTPLNIHENKLKKDHNNLVLEFKRTTDILQHVVQLKRADQKIIGFSVETKNLVENSRQKLQRKKLDAIVANNPKIKGAGFAADTNQVEIITNDQVISLPQISKKKTAHKILDFVKTLGK